MWQNIFFTFHQILIKKQTLLFAGKSMVPLFNFLVSKIPLIAYKIESNNEEQAANNILEVYIEN